MLMADKSAENLRVEIKKIISQVSRIDIVEIEDQVLIRDELGIDSLMAMEILATCEKYLGIKINEKDFAKVERVGEFFDLLLSIYREGSDYRSEQ